MNKTLVTKLTLWSLTLASVFSVSSYGLAKNESNHNEIETSEEDSSSHYSSHSPLSGEELSEAIRQQAENGLSISNLDFAFLVPTKAMNGNYHDQTIEINNGSLSLKVPSDDEPLQFDASLPVTYNNESVVSIRANYSNETLYLSLTDIDSSEKKYDLKYKIGIAKGSSEDELSELIDHLFDLINKYGSIVSNFTSILKTNSFSNDSSSTLKKAKTSLSLSEGEDKGNGNYEYTFQVNIDSFSLPIRLNSDAEGNLRSIAIYDEKESSHFVGLSNSVHSKKIRLTSSIVPLKEGYSFPNLKAEDAQYSRLIDVTGLLDRLYPLAKSPRFSLEGKFNLAHSISDSSANDNVEEATLGLSIKADVSNSFSSSGKRISSDSLPNALNGQFDFVIEPNKENPVSKKLNLDFVREQNEGVYLDKGYAYLTTNALKTKMDFFTLDAMIGKVLDLTNSDSKTSLRGSLTETKVLDIKDILNGLFGKFKLVDTINAILDDYLLITSSGSALSGIETGEYEKMLRLISSIKESSKEVGNKTVPTLDLTIDLKALGLSSGSLVISIYNGSHKRLVGIEIYDFAFGKIAINGYLAFNDESTNSSFFITKPSEEGRAYLRRLPDIFDSLEKLANEKHATISISGHMKSLDSNNPDGFYIDKDSDSKITFDINERKGTGKIVFKDIKGKDADGNEKTQNYQLGIDVIDDAWEEHHRVSKANNMFFMINTPESGAKPLQGRFTMDSLQGILSLFKAFTKTKDERFTKYLDWFTNVESSSVLLKALKANEINPLLSSSLLKSFNLDETNKVAKITVNGSTLSLDSDIILSIAYSGDYYALENQDGFKENSGRKKGNIESINIQTKTKNSDIDFTLKFEKNYVAPGRKLGSSYNWNAFQYSSDGFNGSIVTDENGEYAKHNVEKYTDWSSIQFLLQYLLNSAILGNDETYQFDENNSVNAVTKAKGYSTYHVKDENGITLSASLWSWEIKKITLNLDFYVYLKGETVKVYGYLYTPHIQIIGSLLEANAGKYFAYFGYETSKDNPNGTMYIHRVKKNDDDEVKNISNKKMSGSDFLNKIGETVLLYMMGFEDGVAKEKLEETFSSTPTTTSDKSPIYIEKVFTGNEFKYTTDSDGNPSWTDVALDLNGFNIDKLKGSVNLSFYGSANANTLNKAIATGQISFADVINAKIESGSFILDNNCDGKADDSTLSAWVDSWHNEVGTNEGNFESFKDAVSSDFTQKAQDFAGVYTSDSVRITIKNDGSILAEKRSGGNWVNYFKYNGVITPHDWFVYDENGAKTSWENTNYDYKDGKFKISIKGRDDKPAWSPADSTIILEFVRQSNGTWKEGNNVFTYSK